MLNVAKDVNGLPKRGKQFEAIQLNQIKRNKFNRSYNSRGSYNFAWLYPVDFQKCEPGDTWSVKRSAIIKAAPMVAPIYQKIDVSFHTFAVPLRILCKNYETMRSPGNGDVSLAEALSYDAPKMPSWTFGTLYGVLDLQDPDSEDSTLTIANLSTHTRFRLLDELNMPSPVKYTISPNGSVHASLITMQELGNSQDEEFSVLPLRAYYKVWYDYFRDPNNYSIDKPLDTDTCTTSEFARICQLRPRAWEHDYFTSALLTPQRGPAVTMSLFNDGVITLNNPRFNRSVPDGYDRVASIKSDGRLFSASSIKFQGTGQADAWQMGRMAFNGSLPTPLGMTAEEATGTKPYVPDQYIDSEVRSITGSLSGAQGSVITIEQLRQYNKMQEWLELQARCGARYSEFLLGNFEIVSSDARLQRPEYIAGGMMPLTISDIVNQSEADTGTYSGLAEGQSGDLDKFQYYCEEDMYIITMMSIMPRTSYSQGIRRYWKQLTTFDFYLPKFAQLGEEPVTNDEIYYKFGENEQTQNPSNPKTFGYQARNQYMRYSPDTIHGDFRTTYNFWTLSRLFEDTPTLGYNFISATNADNRNAQLYRFFQVTDPRIDHFYIDIWHDMYVDIKLPEFNVPQL